MLSCSIWFSAPSFWMGGGLESLCVGREYGADGAVHIINNENMDSISISSFSILLSVPQFRSSTIRQ